MRWLGLILTCRLGAIAIAAMLTRGGQWRTTLRLPDLYALVREPVVLFKGSLQFGTFIVAWGNVRAG